MDIPFVDIDCTAVVGRHVTGRAAALGKPLRQKHDRINWQSHKLPVESICHIPKAVNLRRKAVLLFTR